MSEWVNGMFEQFSKVKQVSTITGMDYWTGLPDSPKLQNTCCSSNE